MKRSIACPRIVRCLVFAACLAAGRELTAATSERWCACDCGAAHPGTLAVEEIGPFVRLVFDLSALPTSAKIYGAWLRIEKDDGQPRDPILVYAATELRGGEARHDGKRLELEPPWYRRFVATDVVRRWVAHPETNLGFLIRSFPGFRPTRSALEILHDGSSEKTPPQATRLRVVHRGGQTFIVWTEHPAYCPDPGEVLWVSKFSERGDQMASGPGQGAAGMPNHPGISLRTLRRLQGLRLRDQKSGFQGIRELERAAEVPPVVYRVYRSGERIGRDTILGAELLAEVEPLSGYDQEVYRIHFTGEYLDQWEDPSSVIPTFRIAGGDALRPGEALYVHTPRGSGRSYYAVTTVLAGTENLEEIGPENSLVEAVAEEQAHPLPVLQWVQEDQYHDDPPEYWYRFWVAPPLANLPSRSYRIALAASSGLRGPCPLLIEGISGNFNVRESINLPRPDRVTVAIEEQLPWLPELFYNEGRDTLRAASECKVDYFAERYTLAILEWVFACYPIDRSKIEGSLLYFGLRHPEIFARMSFGTYTATYDYRWAPGDPDHLGPEGIQTVDGEDAWEMYSVGGYVLRYPERDIPFLILISGTGKDSGHTCEFGWQDDPRGWAALLEARQPFVAAWSMDLPRELARGLAELSWGGTIPAFSRSSLDNNPGNGDPADGDYYGQINGYLLWEDRTAVDEPDRWEMTVYVTSDCPRERCVVDITPRHCKRFRPSGRASFEWANTSLADGRLLGKGRVESDARGIVTVPRVEVTKSRNRISIRGPLE